MALAFLLSDEWSAAFQVVIDDAQTVEFPGGHVLRARHRGSGHIVLWYVDDDSHHVRRALFVDRGRRRRITFENGWAASAAPEPGPFEAPRSCAAPEPCHE